MNYTSRPYRVVCFDLDGTLLPMDLDEFMGSYFKSIARFAAERGLNAEKFMDALKRGTHAMAAHDDGATNEEAFWGAFAQVYGEGAENVRKLVGDFYEHDFARIGDGFAGNPAVSRIVANLASKGYPLVLTTMPMFPRRAVEHRLSWAGVEADAFSRITSYENSTSVKPRQTYYAENLAAMGVRGSDVLMVGNNTQEDLAFLDLGVDAYLVTDWLLDPIGFDLDAVKHGSMEQFEEWVDALPSCENPATGIATGVVGHAAMEEAFSANAVCAIDRAQAARDAARIADDVTRVRAVAPDAADAGARASGDTAAKDAIAHEGE